MSNVLAIPLITMVVRTGNNEDWIDPILFLVNDGLDPPQAQLDLRGIDFEMEVRRAPPEHEVVISASTENGMLKIGEVPDYGYLIIQIPVGEMKVNSPGPYVADIIASDPINRRVIVKIDLTLVDGVTK